jgi:hypothetical protein
MLDQPDVRRKAAPVPHGDPAGSALWLLPLSRFVVAHRYGVLVAALVRTSLRLRVAGLLYALSAALFIWSGQVDLIRLQQALAGLLRTFAVVIIAVRLPKKPDDW